MQKKLLSLKNELKIFIVEVILAINTANLQLLYIQLIKLINNSEKKIKTFCAFSS